MSKTCKYISLFSFLFSAWLHVNSQERYSYESVAGDPLQARIYTLDNGLKIYLSVNKTAPRIKALIGVRAGGKNDPAETTGLAHYFEHLMFKGTKQYSTVNYELEKPFLDQIEELFEIYRQTKEESSRRSIYHTIDSLSFIASQYAIPNEYDKLMTFIGSTGSNAYTSYDETVYIEDIPSNQIENWAKIQADRFENIVIRGFHTELEAVYEEKNMYIAEDDNKVFDTAIAALLPHHRYGVQTVLGTQEELKNPSITNIKRFYNTWYVPNNMAICLSGDLDPEQTIGIIDKYFGRMKPNLSLPLLERKPESTIQSPIEKEVLGMEAESLILAWRFPGAGSEEFQKLRVLSQILFNDKAGLLDLNLNQSQKVLGAYCYPLGFADYSLFFMEASPKEGQTLEELRELLLHEIHSLHNGIFDESILQANINNFKLEQIKELERNDGRAFKLLYSFINETNWESEVNALYKMAEITKADIMDFSREWLKENNYVVIYKREGKDPNEITIAKPKITPIATNRDTTSNFFKEIQLTPTTPIEPVFLDFDKDLQVLTAKKDIPVIYKQNENNDLFQLMYVFEMGNCHDKTFDTACKYLEFLGTSDKTLSMIKNEFYRMACNFYIYPGMERMYVVLSGLNENFTEAMQLLEDLMAGAVVNIEAYDNMVSDILKSRKDDKLNQNKNFFNLLNYAIYGPFSPKTNILSQKELLNLNPQELVDRIHNLNSYKHRILYYGPISDTELLSVIDKYHRVPDSSLWDIPINTGYPRLETPTIKIYIAPYDAKQIHMAQYTNMSFKFDTSIEPLREMYNEYFGNNMSSIVFQELRERRGLAYAASAALLQPTFLKYPYTLRSHIITQNDKIFDAIHTFNTIFHDMPESENSFKLSQEGLLNRLRTERIIKSDVLWAYINAQDLGINTDPRIDIYNHVKKIKLSDIVFFQQEWIKGCTFVYCILGNKEDLNMEELNKIGSIEELTQEQIFGY